jgi:hypothetical protein
MSTRNQAISLIASGLSVFGIPFIHSENEGVILATIFGGINVITFNSFGCTSSEVYSTKLRSTSQVKELARLILAISNCILFKLYIYEIFISFFLSFKLLKSHVTSFLSLIIEIKINFKKITI